MDGDTTEAPDTMEGDLTTNVREILADFEETLRKSQQQFAGEIQEMCKYVPLG